MLLRRLLEYHSNQRTCAHCKSADQKQTNQQDSSQHRLSYRSLFWAWKQRTLVTCSYVLNTGANSASCSGLTDSIMPLSPKHQIQRLESGIGTPTRSPASLRTLPCATPSSHSQWNSIFIGPPSQKLAQQWAGPIVHKNGRFDKSSGSWLKFALYQHPHHIKYIYIVETQ